MEMAFEDCQVMARALITEFIFRIAASKGLEGLWVRPPMHSAN
jgi:hypothetical protein